VSDGLQRSPSARTWQRSSELCFSYGFSNGP